ncbi:MAG: zf-HC2 domain-containing protein [Candidatus Rokubacteria bacterium]|nr:zf-HC2 domain-containing protein [Candidatus Rokubacteria bacterium]
MICHEFLRAVDAYLDDELSVMQALRMHGHLVSCEPCRRVMESEARLHALLSDAATGDEPPSSLRDRILQRVISEEASVFGVRSRPRSLGRVGGWLVGAAMAGLVVLVSLIPGNQRPAALTPLAAEVAAKHLLYSAGSASELPASEPSQLAQWLEDRVGFPVSLPHLGADQRLVGGRASSVADAPAAYLLYESRGRRISLFVTRPVPAAGRGASERVVQGVDVHASVLEGIHLMWWADKEDGQLYVVASSGGASELMDFARLCIQSEHAGQPSTPHWQPVAPTQGTHLEGERPQRLS